MESYLAQGIEHVVEKRQDLAFGNLGNIVHAFARIVSNPCILIGEAGKHRGNNLFQVFGNFVLLARQTLTDCSEY